MNTSGRIHRGRNMNACWIRMLTWSHSRKEEYQPGETKVPGKVLEQVPREDQVLVYGR